MRAIRKSRLVEVAEGSLRRAIFRPAWSPMKIITIPRGAGAYRSGNRAFDINRRTLDALKCHAGDRVRLVRLCAGRKQHDFMD